jgi:hypothetical protein
VPLPRDTSCAPFPFQGAWAGGSMTKAVERIDSPMWTNRRLCCFVKQLGGTINKLRESIAF